MPANWPNIRFDYAGATVLVTGGTSGIGAGIAAAYRDAGAEVTITGMRQSPADYDEDLAGYGYHRLDLEDYETIDALAASLPKLDILVNNAGLVFHNLSLDEYEPEIFDRALKIHLSGGFRLATRCRDKLSASSLPGGASLIGIASMSSYFGIESVPGYGTGKTGLLGMTRVLALHWAKQNIRVNAVAPGLTHSRAAASSIADPVYGGATIARTPAGRFGDPEDIAGAVLFLTSAAASWITGQTLNVDGGYSICG
jgi:NAD(P)-dependent dehydrogenase (short-subunit alcohol dehydrogenase family)